MISYIFPGQGSQFKGMGRGLFDLFPEQEKEADEILGYSIRSLCTEDPGGNLNNTEYTQPAIYVVSALSYLKEVADNDVRPDYLAGHSLGEYNALNVAGALSFGDGLRLVKKRGELMSLAENGAMAAILNLPEIDLIALINANGLNNVDIANYNARTQIVISGRREEVTNSQQYIESADGVFIPLNTSGAFHSRLMASSAKEFGEFISNFEFGEITIPVISNVSAQPYEQVDIAQNLAKQITGAVLWYQTIEYLLGLGVSEFKEIGAGDVLTKLSKKICDAYCVPPQGIRAPELDGVERDKREALKVVDKWNASHDIGESVSVTGLGGRFITRSKAINLFGFRPVMYLEGIEGYLPLSGIR